ncbi:hypothetical protein [Yinghuangia soli]|uniref:Uncharacterized protein n=1 Tax=Yinghuangia soli TaxID=2908204 RepID=A0AA41PUR7_9ACTN|nr:hypothetical protein [Yinghuangia soli]MCF2526238.1 hypothetical protein [Yinghuangia soli]
MLTSFDDFPVHQTPMPVAVPASSDRNAYGRYWFGAAERSGRFIVEAAFGRYANLGVADAHLSISRGGVQDAFHASGPAPADPASTGVGPFRLRVAEPMRHLVITIADNSTGITADLEWRARVGALEEDHTVMHDGVGRVMVDMARFLQFGTWAGQVTVDGETTELAHADVVGVRDRSWGVRPVGAQPQGRPASQLPNAWLWAPVHFADECRTLGYFQKPGGEIWRGDGFAIPAPDRPYDRVPQVTGHGDAGVLRLEPLGDRLTFAPGTRRVTRAEFDVRMPDGSTQTLELEPLRHIMMKGLGYTSPEWGHGLWKGEDATGRETWKLDEADPGDFTAQHLHHVVKARIGDREGVGFLEQIIFGPHRQYGFTELLDGAR